MTPEPGEHTAASVDMVQLTESYRFDDELAALLTAFQYRDDGITLTGTTPTRVPDDAYHAPTRGIETVYDAAASLVFICYDDRRHQMVNPIETTLITAVTDALTTHAPNTNPEADAATPLGEGPTPQATPPTSPPEAPADDAALSVGVVTPHNAQRGALAAQTADHVEANTVEKYQGGERDVIAVSATVSDPEFARREEQFILNPRRLLVAISRARLLTVVVCSRSLFEVAPGTADGLAHGPVWARLFTLAVGQDTAPAWDGPLHAFTGTDTATDPLSVAVYPSTLPAESTPGGESE